MTHSIVAYRDLATTHAHIHIHVRVRVHVEK